MRAYIGKDVARRKWREGQERRKKRSGRKCGWEERERSVGCSQLIIINSECLVDPPLTVITGAGATTTEAHLSIQLRKRQTTDSVTRCHSCQVT